MGYWAEVYGNLFNGVSGPSTRGFFRNVDRTRRQGLEFALVSVISDFQLRGSLALVRATFRSEETLASALEEEGKGGVEVAPGDQFAVAPNVTFELGATYTRGPLVGRPGGEFRR